MPSLAPIEVLPDVALEVPIDDLSLMFTLPAVILSEPSRSPASSVATDGWPVRNHLLERISEAERLLLAAHLELVPLASDQVLYGPGAPMPHVYFRLNGVIALVAIMRDGATSETAMIGCEGAAAISAGGFVEPAFMSFVVEFPGEACRVEAAVFEEMIDTSPTFCSAVTRWREVFLRMTLQLVACNSLHSVRQRAARWILASHDRAEGMLLPLTQAFLAEMPGVKRNAVNIVARNLQAQGLIEYKRGRVTVLDVENLRVVSCECYAIIHDEIAQL